LEPRPVPKLEAIRQRILPLEATVAKAFISAMAEHSLGYGYKGMGNFRDAARCFARASELAGFYEFYTLPIYRSALGKLMWESGQYRKALELHCDGDTRRLARDLGDEHFLIDSHLCAAKAALDLGALEKAKEELKAAEIHLADDESRYPILHAYHDVFEAQLSAKLGHGDLARATLQRAIEQFQQMAPPCYLGTLDCKIELIRLDLVEGDLGAVLRQLEPLIEEAESREVMGARTRLLAFQARLYLDPNVPAPLLRDGYNAQNQRLELINNPRLTFLAYSDLYTYARRHLESEEQKRWLLRLRNLEPLLERSCYEELYRDYVTERYRSELERELDEHGKDGTFK